MFFFTHLYKGRNHKDTIHLGVLEDPEASDIASRRCRVHCIE